jgi:uncharacterized membrane protein
LTQDLAVRCSTFTREHGDMESRAKLFGHSIHQMLIVFPLGLLATGVVFDVIHLAGGAARFADVGSWWLRRGQPASPPATAYLLSFVGIAIALVTAWLGGELVDRLGVGIDDGAHLDAPSSLSGRPAAAHAGNPQRAG